MKSQPNSDNSVGRPARISRQDIAQTALDMGLNNITVKKIAAQLGVDHSSLYRHISNREDIIYSAVDLAVAKIRIHPKSDDWKSYLYALAVSVWELYEKHPGLANILRIHERTPPSVIRTFVNACHQLEEYHFSGEAAALVIDSIMDMTTDSAAGWQQLNTPNAKGVRGVDILSQSWKLARTARGDKHIDYVIDFLTDDPRLWWEKKLALLIAGAEVYLT